MGISRKNRYDVGYGLNNALQNLAPQPILGKRAPTTSDIAQPGTIWINGTAFYILTQVSAGVATWFGFETNVFSGSGAPTFAAPKGSLYTNTAGSSTSTRVYVNTNGASTWTNLVTAA